MPLGLVGPGLNRGLVTGYLSLVVLVPIAALVAASFEDGFASFWDAVTFGPALDALEWTLIAALAVAVINGILGIVVAWVLVRDGFPGRRIINSLIDLPFALPTIVAGLTLLALYGDDGLLGISGVAYTRLGVVLALLFVTLPFVVRAVQPVLLELDTEIEEAAASLGARPLTIFRRIILPSLTPAIVSGVGLAFARAVGEFGSVILIAGGALNAQVASVYIFGQIESGGQAAAAAVSVVLLVISLLMLLLINGIGAWSSRHGR